MGFDRLRRDEQPRRDFSLAQTSRQVAKRLALSRRQIYHPDVVGLMKSEQLRHYALHVAKLAGAASELISSPGCWKDFQATRLQDTFLFGIKLSTVTGEKLGGTSVQRDLARALVAAR